MSLTILPTINYSQTTELFNLQAVGLNTRKRRGEVAEAAFLAKASSLGFGVSKPWGDSERYDFVLDSGRKFWRIQVKSTERFAESRYRVKTSGWKDTYTRDEIDFIVVYIVPEDLWYIVPIEAAVSRKGCASIPTAKAKAPWKNIAKPGTSCVAWTLLPAYLDQIRRRRAQRAANNSASLKETSTILWHPIRNHGYRPRYRHLQ